MSGFLVPMFFFFKKKPPFFLIDVLLNLFIAIVLEHFELDDDEKYKKQLEMYFERHRRSKVNKTQSVFQ